MEATSTPDGHSLTHALQPTQRSMTSCMRLAGQLGHRQRAVEDGAQGVRAGARRVALVARDHVRGAHRAGADLAALRGAVAQLDRADERPLAAEVELRRHRAAVAVGADAQVGVHARGTDDDARVQQAVRVPRRLELGEGADELRPVHPLEELRARQAVAVLARERPAELDDEVGDALGDAAHPGDVARLARVQRGADVQAADRRVPVEAGPRPLALQQLLEAHDELLQPVRPHGGVLDERDGLRRVRAAEQQREDRRAQAHRLRLVGGVGQQRDVVGADARGRSPPPRRAARRPPPPSRSTRRAAGRPDRRARTRCCRARSGSRGRGRSRRGRAARRRSGPRAARAASRGPPRRASGTAATPSRGRPAAGAGGRRRGS